MAAVDPDADPRGVGARCLPGRNTTASRRSVARPSPLSRRTESMTAVCRVNRPREGHRTRAIAPGRLGEPNPHGPPALTRGVIVASASTALKWESSAVTSPETFGAARVAVCVTVVVVAVVSTRADLWTSPHRRSTLFWRCRLGWRTSGRRWPPRSGPRPAPDARHEAPRRDARAGGVAAGPGPVGPGLVGPGLVAGRAGVAGARPSDGPSTTGRTRVWARTVRSSGSATEVAATTSARVVTVVVAEFAADALVEQFRREGGQQTGGQCRRCRRRP